MQETKKVTNDTDSSPESTGSIRTIFQRSNSLSERRNPKKGIVTVKGINPELPDNSSSNHYQIKISSDSLSSDSSRKSTSEPNSPHIREKDSASPVQALKEPSTAWVESKETDKTEDKTEDKQKKMEKNIENGNSNSSKNISTVQNISNLDADDEELERLQRKYKQSTFNSKEVEQLLQKPFVIEKTKARLRQEKEEEKDKKKKEKELDKKRRGAGDIGKKMTRQASSSNSLL